MLHLQETYLARNCYAGITCTNCQYQGHKESVCRNPPWCSVHNMIGHKTANTRARNQNFYKGQRDESDTTYSLPLLPKPGHHTLM